MNIIFLTFYYPPDLCAGSFRAKSIVESLQKQMSAEDRLYVLTTQPNRYATYIVNADKEEHQNGTSIYRFNVGKHQSGLIDQSIAFFKFVKQTYCIARKIDADIVVATSSRLMTGVLGAYLASKKHAKYFLDLRDIFSETLTELFYRKSKILSGLISPILSYLEKYTIRKADKVNIVSEGFKEYFNEKNIDTSKWLFLPNGIDLEFIVNSKRKQEIRNDKIQVLYAGNIGAGQGLDRILPEVSKQLAETHEFVVIGDGGAKKTLIKKIAECESNNIKIVDPINREKLIEYYNKTDILFLHLNDYKSFRRVLPSKIFEYSAIGKPIVAGVSGYSAMFISKNVPYATVFNPCDIYACVKAIRDASHTNVSEQSRNKFIDSYRRDVLSDKIANEILDLYQI